jgi:hypothetical protein
MPVTWHVDESGLLHVSGTGTVTDAEYLEAHKGFMAATADQVGPRRTLGDWTGVTAMQLTARGIQSSVEISGQEAHRVVTRHRIALVATSPAVYGMCRMWQTMMSESGVECVVLASREEALAWLSS